jgi:hypothetical protein
MDMDPKSGVPIMLVYQCLLELAPLTSDVEWRKLRIEGCPKEDLEEDLDYVLSGRGQPLLGPG